MKPDPLPQSAWRGSPPWALGAVIVAPPGDGPDKLPPVPAGQAWEQDPDRPGYWTLVVPRPSGPPPISFWPGRLADELDEEVARLRNLVATAATPNQWWAAETSRITLRSLAAALRRLDAAAGETEPPAT